MTAVPEGGARLRVFADPRAMARAAAAELFTRFASLAHRRGRFAVALSGGTTVRLLCAALVESAPPGFPWADVHWFWGDERTVAPDDAGSNFHTARQALFDHIDAPESNLHRWRGEDPDPERAAAAYEQELRRFFALAPGSLPRFDLVYLGMGADGHTASLFPGTPALAETLRLAVANPVATLGTTRLTLTLPVLERAACVIFLVSGAEKAEMLRRVLSEPRHPALLPAQAVRLVGGELQWLVDAAAARLLPEGGIACKSE